MIGHRDLGSQAFERSRRLKQLIDTGSIAIAGNRKLKIYGRLDCSSGKRLKAENRVFFETEKEALAEGYRPCGHCMRAGYLEWKAAAGE